jgi:hypothetical protein
MPSIPPSFHPFSSIVHSAFLSSLRPSMSLPSSILPSIHASLVIFFIFPSVRPSRILRLEKEKLKKEEHFPYILPFYS